AEAKGAARRTGLTRTRKIGRRFCAQTHANPAASTAPWLSLARPVRQYLLPQVPDPTSRRKPADPAPRRCRRQRRLSAPTGWASPRIGDTAPSREHATVPAG